jgi:hypothetical protein
MRILFLQLLNLISQISVSHEPATAYMQLPGQEAVEIGRLQVQDSGNREWFAELAYITTALCRCQPSSAQKFRLDSIMKKKSSSSIFRRRDWRGNRSRENGGDQ